MRVACECRHTRKQILQQRRRMIRRQSDWNIFFVARSEHVSQRECVQAGVRDAEQSIVTVLGSQVYGAIVQKLLRE